MSASTAGRAARTPQRGSRTAPPGPPTPPSPPGAGARRHPNGREVQPPGSGVHASPAYPASILKALAQVRAAVPGVPKTGKNAVHGYSYSSEADVLAAYNPAMNEAGLIVLPAVVESHERTIRTSGGGPSSITRVVMEFTLAHRDGDVWPVPLRWEALGEDAQDKGLAKAITSATKYFLTSLFQAEKGTDPDATGRPENRSSPAPLSRDAAAPPAAGAGTAQGSAPAPPASARRMTVPEFKRLWRNAVRTAGPDAAWDFWLSVREELQAVCASMGEWTHVCKVVKDGMAQLGMPKEHAAEGLPSWQEAQLTPRDTANRR